MSDATLSQGPDDFAELRGERTRLLAMFRQAPAAIALLVGPEHRFTMANARYRALVRGRDVEGKSVREAFPDLAGQGVYDLLDEVYRTGRPHEAHEMPVQLRARDGAAVTELFVDFVYQPMLDADGQTFGVMVHAVDVSDRVVSRRQVESLNARLQAQAAELGQVTEHLHQANVVAEQARAEVETLNRIGNALAAEFDVERIVQSVTDATTSLTGAQFGAFFYNVIDAQGEKLTLYTLSGAPREAFADFGHPRATPVFAPTFHGTGIVRSDDITADPRYGRMGPHHGMPRGHLPVRSYLAVPVMSRTGDVLGGLFFGHAERAVFTDRAERLASGVAAWAAVAMDNARLYDAERSARAAAEGANLAKSQFLANMSHELRTPLNAIGGYTDLILEGIRGPVTDAQRADLERVKRSQRHLLSLINDILNFAKIEAGRVHLDLRDVSMNETLGQLESLVAPQLLQKELRYEYHCCDPSYTSWADPERLQQILLNLLSNAVKFTPPGGSIVVECGATGDAMMVHVEDTGVGIPADKLEHIFEPFVQLDRGQTSTTGGTGLGLAISRDLARAMGGDLTVVSEVARGSTFMLRLPRRPREAAE